MGKTERFLVLDAGTTAVKALVFSSDLVCMVEASRPTQTHTPRPGWAEQDAGEYAALAKAVLAEVAPHGPFVAAALTNQRETAVAWDRETGVPLAPMILWHDGRSSDALEVLAGRERDVRQVTGLVPSAYFSASKFAWLSEQVPAVRQAAATGRLAMGTVDSWLMAQLTSERRHQTDESNASRTLLFDIRNRQWDPELCTLFGVATEALPATRHSQSAFGMLQVSDSGISSPLCVVVGDQQASLAAAGTAPGTTTVTHGTGTFLIQALGDEFTLTDHAYTTLAPGRMRSQYAVEVNIGRYGQRVDAALQAGQDIAPILEEIALAVASALQQLPQRPTELVVTGGISRDPRLAAFHQRTAGIPVRQHATHHGTALGAASLLKASVRQNMEQ